MDFTLIKNRNIEKPSDIWNSGPEKTVICDEEVFTKLQNLHPERLINFSENFNCNHFVFDNTSTKKAILNYPKGGAGGVSFWDPALFPKNLYEIFKKIFTCLVSLISSGSVPDKFNLFLRIGKLIAIPKKEMEFDLLLWAMFF
ncbi:hypothetical protein RCL1_006499 [Eukaryota sp. TZLM3-RCL]